MTLAERLHFRRAVEEEYRRLQDDIWRRFELYTFEGEWDADKIINECQELAIRLVEEAGAA